MNRPEYMTAEEFCSLAIDICKEIGYFSPDDVMHPGDLEVNMSGVMQAISMTTQHIMDKRRKQEVYGHKHVNDV